MNIELYTFLSIKFPFIVRSKDCSTRQKWQQVLKSCSTICSFNVAETEIAEALMLKLTFQLQQVRWRKPLTYRCLIRTIKRTRIDWKTLKSQTPPKSERHFAAPLLSVQTLTCSIVQRLMLAMSILFLISVSWSPILPKAKVICRREGMFDHGVNN